MPRTTLNSGGPMPELSGEAVGIGALDGGDSLIQLSAPYRVVVTLVGTAPLLMHKYNVASVAEKGTAAKGSATKKTDNVESYTYRDEEGYLGLDGRMFAACIREAGRSEPDPRSPRKSMRDLLSSIVIPVNETERFIPHVKEWDSLNQSRVVVQRSAVTRSRPCMHRGWKISFTLDITSSDYLPAQLLRKLIVNAGRLQGIADWRPIYGRFDMVGFEVTAYE